MDTAFALDSFHASIQHASIPTLHIAFSVVVIVAALATAFHLYSEWLAFKALGPGGTPQTVFGFLKVFILGFVAISDPYEVPEPPFYDRGHLQSLPHRPDPRPGTRGIAPHRQVDQKGSASTYELLVSKIEHMGSSSPGLFVGTSCFEKHSTGLFAAHPVSKTCGGEICHTHPSDGGSLHLTLHAADVKIVLETGWGERHPLSRGGWFERFVPAGFVMAYAPRDKDEVEIVLEIVRAARWFVCVGDKSKVGHELGSDPAEVVPAWEGL